MARRSKLNGSTSLDTRRGKLKTPDDDMLNGDYLNRMTKLARGDRLLAEGLNTPRGRFMQDVYTALIMDQGGTQNTSTIQRELLRRFSGLSVIAMELESTIASSERSVESLEECLAVYGGIIKTMNLIAGRIGLSRIPRNINEPQTLEEYAAIVNDS